MPFTEDLDEFLDPTDGFAYGATKGSTPFAGIYTAANADVLGVEGTRPTFLVKDAAIASVGIAHGSTILVTDLATFFVVRSIQPDGTGMSFLVLEET